MYAGSHTGVRGFAMSPILGDYPNLLGRCTVKASEANLIEL